MISSKEAGHERQSWDTTGMTAPQTTLTRFARLKRLALPGAIGLVAATVGLLVAQHLHHPNRPTVTTQFAAVYPRPRKLDTFVLETNQHVPFDHAYLQGHMTVLFFGYINCPDACPTTLLELAAARRLLQDMAPSQQPHVVMVTVDPARDSAERLDAYVHHFDASFTGVTGDQANLDALAKSLGVAVIHGPVVDGTYSMDHTAAAFLINSAAEVVAVFPAPHAAKSVAADYRRIMAAQGN